MKKIKGKYAILFWEGGNLYPLLRKDKTLVTYNTLKKVRQKIYPFDNCEIISTKDFGKF